MTIKDILKQILKTDEEIYSIIGKVSEINVTERTCTVNPIDGSAELIDVKLQANINLLSGIFIKPVDGSDVIVSFTSKENAFVSVYSEIESIEINGSTYGGLVKVEPLVNKINQLENRMNSHQHLDPASGITLTDPASNPLITLTTVTELENANIKHG